MRNKRRAFAAPGSSHDRLIRFLVRVLPAGVGAVAAVMILAPFTPRGEISFLLDRNRVAVTSERAIAPESSVPSTRSLASMGREKALCKSF